MEYKFFIQKLYSEDQFNQLLHQNFIKLSTWRKYYPNHGDWINSVIKQLASSKEEIKSRVAIGCYVSVEGKSSQLCASVLLKTKTYSKELEIKNLIVFDKFEKLQYHFEEKAVKALLSYLIRYAGERGFSGLTSELIPDTKNYLTTYLESSFLIDGTRKNKYNNFVDTIYLKKDINSLMGIDPYDNISYSKWIFEKFLKCNLFAPTEDLCFLTLEVKEKNNDSATEDVKNELELNVFEIGYDFDLNERLKEKFRNKNRLLIIDERTLNTNINEVGYLKNIDPNYKNYFTYIFDYTSWNISKKIVVETDRFEVFNGQDIKTLTGLDITNNEKFRFSFDKLGGLLIFAEPGSMELNRIEEIYSEGAIPVFIKLGSLGRYVVDEENIPIYFSYLPSDGETEAYVWARAKMANIAKYKDLCYEKELRYRKEPNPTNYQYDEADCLFDYIVNELNDEDDPNEKRFESIWTKKQFKYFNGFNASSRVVVLTFEQFEVFKEQSKVKLATCLEDQNYLDTSENLYDFYLSKTEITNLDRELNNIECVNYSDNTDVNLLPKVIYAGADHRVKPKINIDKEFEYLNVLNSQKIIKFQNCVPSSLNKITEVVTGQTEMVIISCHGEKAGLYLVDDSENEQFESLQNVVNTLKLLKSVRYLILSACNSDVIAEDLRADFEIIIYIKDAINIDVAGRFLRYFCLRLLNSEFNNEGILKVYKDTIQALKNENLEDVSKIDITA